MQWEKKVVWILFQLSTAPSLNAIKVHATNCSNLKVSSHSFFINFVLVNSNKCPASRFWWKKKCSGVPVSHCSSVVEEVGGEERPDFGSYSSHS